MRLIAILALAALAACSRPQHQAAASAAPSLARQAPARIVQRITGEVTPANAERFAELVGGQEDQIIGLKLNIQPGTDADFKASRYMAEPSDQLFVVSIGDGDAEGDGTEVVMPTAEASLLHGSYVVDGFYQVKAGGMHQGIVSWGLEKIDPGSVLLNPQVAVQDKALP
jgi:ABC-type Fe3+-hydroxamate transport system substrate-binding protein